MIANKDVKHLIDVRIILSALWIARMLTGFVGDVLKFYEPGITAQIVAGEVNGLPLTEEFLLVAAITFMLPVFMVFLALTLPHKPNRWANIVVAIIFFALNLFGELPNYEYAYRTFLVIVEMVFLALIVWYAWKWTKQDRALAG